MLSPMFKQELTGQDTPTLRRKIDCTDLVTKYYPITKIQSSLKESLSINSKGNTPLYSIANLNAK
jgi:hypothetical protein